MTHSQEQDWLSRAEACSYLGVSESSLLRYEKRGAITPYRTPGGHRRYRREDLDSVLRKSAS